MTQKDERLTIRITPAQREKLEHIAAFHDRPVSWVIRQWIDNAPDDEAAINDIFKKHDAAFRGLKDK